MVVFGVVLSATSCASTQQQGDQIDHALSLCKELVGADANKGEGEAWFWLQSERAKASRSLWNPRGVRAIDARLAAATNEVERSCLKQLRQEAVTHELVRE